MKEIKLRKVSSVKFCTDCRKKVVIVMKGLHGSCPDCGTRLYTLDNRQKIDKREENKYGK